MQRTCTMPGCDKPHRARGLCATCYNRQHQTPEQRHPKVTVPCAWCQKPCIKDKGRENRYGALYCDVTCLGAWRARQTDLRKLPVLYTGKLTEVDGLPPRTVQHVRGSSIWIAGFCARCGEAFTVEHQLQARYCSTRCSRRVTKQAYRARKKDAFVERVSPRRIYERDGWRCKLCRKKVQRDKVAPHPLAPTLDHIIPLTAGVENGGVHAPHNVQCAHFICNSRKSGRIDDVQLMLFG